MTDVPRTDTATLAEAMDILARDIQSGDGVANAAIAEAAQRLRELEQMTEAAEQLAKLAERCGGQEIVFEGSSYIAVEPECLDELADAGTRFRNTLARHHGQPDHKPTTGPSVGRQTMLGVDGKSFRCECGTNVFTEVRSGEYLCNACKARYHGQKGNDDGK